MERSERGLATNGHTLGGRPRLRGTAGVVGSALAVPFLFLLPFGRPRGLFTGVSVAVGSAAPRLEADDAGVPLSVMAGAPLSRRSFRSLNRKENSGCKNIAVNTARKM